MRIERLWVDVTAQVGAAWADRFTTFELHHGLDINNTNHIWLLHHLFLHILNAELAFFAESWNEHKIQIRNGPNRSPLDMFYFDMLVHGVRGRAPPQEVGVMENLTDEELEVYGIDWEALRDEQLLTSRQDNNDRTEGWSTWIGEGTPDNLNEIAVEPPPEPSQLRVVFDLDNYLGPFPEHPTNADFIQHWTRALAYMRSVIHGF